jgi:hypothetical protein
VFYHVSHYPVHLSHAPSPLAVILTRMAGCYLVMMNRNTISGVLDGGYHVAQRVLTVAKCRRSLWNLLIQRLKLNVIIWKMTHVGFALKPG